MDKKLRLLLHLLKKIFPSLSIYSYTPLDAFFLIIA